MNKFVIPLKGGGFREVEVQTSNELLAQWLSTSCSCGGIKRQRHMFCPACYSRLPSQMKIDVYRLVGRNGYEVAIAKAKEFLKGESHGESPLRS